jgi:hypothetical protein
MAPTTITPINIALSVDDKPGCDDRGFTISSSGRADSVRTRQAIVASYQRIESSWPALAAARHRCLHQRHDWRNGSDNLLGRSGNRNADMPLKDSSNLTHAA